MLAALVLVNELIKLATGQLSEEDLIGVTESDDMPHGDPISELHRRLPMTIAIFLGAAGRDGAGRADRLLAAAVRCRADVAPRHVRRPDPGAERDRGQQQLPLLAVPFFMLAGEIMNAGGLSRRIVNFAMALVGHVRGGLGYVGIMAAIIMAALSGSAVADAARSPALLLPMMNRAGYDTARRPACCRRPASSRPSSRPRSASWSSASLPTSRSPSCSWLASRRACCWPGAVADLVVAGAQGGHQGRAAQERRDDCAEGRDLALVPPVIVVVGPSSACSRRPKRPWSPRSTRCSSRP